MIIHTLFFPTDIEDQLRQLEQNGKVTIIMPSVINLLDVQLQYMYMTATMSIKRDSPSPGARGRHTAEVTGSVESNTAVCTAEHGDGYQVQQPSV